MTREAELRALRAQIDPHFLYNSLNSISALTGSDAAGARRMCLLLGEFLRNTLDVSARQRIPLADELALAERFLKSSRSASDRACGSSSASTRTRQRAWCRRWCCSRWWRMR